jgi:hypothetical protein
VKLNFGDVIRLVRNTKEAIRAEKTPEKFEMYLAESAEFFGVELDDVDEELISRKRKRNDSASFDSASKEVLKQEYFQFVDTLLEELDSRFSKQAIQLYKAYEELSFVEKGAEISKFCAVFELFKLDLIEQTLFLSELKMFIIGNKANILTCGDLDSIYYLIQDNPSYTNLLDVYKRALVVPVGTPEAERSFSTQKHFCALQWKKIV